MRLRRLFSTSVWCVSARPSSHGVPACLIEESGDAPVPPSCPLIRTTSACAFETPAAMVPTPTSDTSLTLMRAWRVGVLWGRVNSGGGFVGGREWGGGGGGCAAARGGGRGGGGLGG